MCLSSASKRNADALADPISGTESSSKKQKTGETMDEDPQVPAQADEDEPTDTNDKPITRGRPEMQDEMRIDRREIEERGELRVLFSSQEMNGS